MNPAELSRRIANRLRRRQARRILAAHPHPDRLHLGCGSVHFPGWVHLDADRAIPHVDARWEANDGLPCADQSCVFIYSEHFIEHLPPEAAAFLFQECRRVLKPDGVLRTAMPDLKYCVERYTQGDWRDQAWIREFGYQHVRTGCEMLNISFRHWGHRWLYDREELHRRLHDAGFTRITDVAAGQSEHPELRQRETRTDSWLICEASP